MKNKINFSIGDCFSVPLRSGGYVRGVVIKADYKGIIFGCFYGPIFDSEKDMVPIGVSEIDDFVLAGMFGDLGLINGEWKTLGAVENFDAGNYIMPKFLKVDDEDGSCALSSYDENDFSLLCQEEVNLSEQEKNKYSKDIMMGYGSVEIRLTRHFDS